MKGRLIALAILAALVVGRCSTAPAPKRTTATRVAAADGTLLVGTFIVTDIDCAYVRSGPDSSTPRVGCEGPSVRGVTLGSASADAATAGRFWYQIRFDDGLTGYLPSEHVVFLSPPLTLAQQIEELKARVSALEQTPTPTPTP